MLTIYPRPEEFIGQEVDGHRIDAVLGRGGMGIVFKAENLELSRTVALKIINPALAQDESFLRRFRAEARALAQIHHPNIVIVYDFRQFDMGFYISMEYVEGPTLADHMEVEGPIPWKEGLYLTKQMLSAFHYAHSCGVIHRDIKPRNILLAKNNVVKITDFGLAKILQEGKRTTDTTVTMATGGTIHYMPPEQIRGLRNVDHRGDIFSLGMTIYEAIAGVLPFEKNASGYTIQKMIVEEPFPDLRKRDASIPKALSKIIMKSLEKEPHKRFQSAAEMISALEEFELNQSKTALTVGGASTGGYADAASFTRRWKIYAALAALLVVAGSFIAFAMPEKLSAFITGESAERPTLAEQLIEDPPAITKAEAAPISEIELNPIEAETETLPGIDSLNSELTPDSSNTATSSSTDPGLESEPDVAANASTNNPQEATSTGSIRVDSAPKGASVLVNGAFQGNTPMFLDNLKTGSVDVELRLNHHETYKTTVRIREFQVSRITGNLSPITGLLKLNINPTSELYIDGELVEKDAGENVRLPILATSHDIMITNMQHGQWAKRIDIQAADSLELAVDFTKSVRLIVTAFDTGQNGMHTEILLDGKPTGLYTPTPIEIPVGVHVLQVKAEGFEMVDDVQEFNYDESTESPIKYIMRKSD